MVTLTSYTSTMSIDSTTVLSISPNGVEEMNEKHSIFHHHEKKLINKEVRNAIRELIFPLLLSGFGNMGAGVILQSVKGWTVFNVFPLLITLVPALLGLKGNVEMTLSSRLGTYAHLGHFDDKLKRKNIVVGSIALAQCQAAVVGLITPLISLLFNYFLGINEQLSGSGISLIIACSVAASGSADFILSSSMCAIILISHLCMKINVDNIATPIAASIGDVLTMGFLAAFSRMFYALTEVYKFITLTPIIIWILIALITAYVSYQNDYMKSIIVHGWTPLIVSMTIQNVSGILMGNFINEFKSVSAFPIINGFGGNLVAIQSSRLASHLHKSSRLKELPADDPHIITSPWSFLFKKTSESKLALMLILLAGPLPIPYIIISRYILQTSVLTAESILMYYICATIQVTITLYVGYLFVRILWRIGFDPDNSAIPILTALADLFGSISLVLGFKLLRVIGDPNAI